MVEVMAAPHSVTPTRVGFATPPSYFDTTATRIRAFVGQRIETIQTIIHHPGFVYDAEHYIAGWPACEHALRDLADAGVDLVVQVGSPFLYFHPLGYDGLLQRRNALEQDLGKPLILSALALVEALHHLKIGTVALAGMYYPFEWMAEMERFLLKAGVKVAASETFVDQGLVGGTRGENERVGWTFGPELIAQSLLLTAARSDTADAVVIGGVPGDLQPQIADLESQIGRPILGVDGATLWQIMRLIGLKKPTGEHGTLLCSLPG